MSRANRRERAADSRLSLYRHAKRLHELAPNVPLPKGGYPLPNPANHRQSSQVSYEEAKATQKAILEAYFADGNLPIHVLHDALRATDREIFESVVDNMVISDTRRAHRTAVWLVRNGTDSRPVRAGLLLLARFGEPGDAPLIRTIGLLNLFNRFAVAALAHIEGTTADLIWLADRCATVYRYTAIRYLCERGDPKALPWLTRQGREDPGLPSELAQKVAEAVHLGDALNTGSPHDEDVQTVGQLLVAMATNYEGSSLRLREFLGATKTYAAFATHAAEIKPSLDRFAMIATMAEDLRAGETACLAWHGNDRWRIMARLRELLRSTPWMAVYAKTMTFTDPATRWRAEWAATATLTLIDPPGRQTSRNQYNEIDIQVVVPDPQRYCGVRTRILIDGHPVIAKAFTSGPVAEPEELLAPTGGLPASTEPHEVRLAAASCDEQCCGALFVTIVRDGNEIVWTNWRRSIGHQPELPELRFNADAYDREVSRASGDHDWEWPARTLARLLRSELAADPALLTRWNCELAWLVARNARRDNAVLSAYSYPNPSDRTQWSQVALVFPIANREPVEYVADLVEEFRRHDPRTSRYLADNDWPSG